MKRSALLEHLRHHGCVLKREGRSHSPWLNLRTRYDIEVEKDRLGERLETEVLRRAV